MFYVSFLVVAAGSERTEIVFELVVTTFELMLLCNALDVLLVPAFRVPAAIEETGGLIGVVMSSILINCSMGINDSSPPGACIGACNLLRAWK